MSYLKEFRATVGELLFVLACYLITIIGVFLTTSTIPISVFVLGGLGIAGLSALATYNYVNLNETIKALEEDS